MKTSMYKPQDRTFKEASPDTDHVINPGLIWFDEITEDGDEMFIKWLKRRPNPWLQKFPKAVVQDEVKFESVREYCQADVERKHPCIFKITDLVEDEGEFSRLKTTLERNRETEKLLGWPAPPMLIEAIPDANILARACTDLMSQLTALAKEYKVEIYFGTKPALKTALYTLMYGGKKKDLDMSQIDEISVEKAEEMFNKQTRVAILGGHGLGFRNMAKLLADQICEEVRRVESFDTWNFKDFAAIAKAEKPARDWEQGKLRRGKGHNKFKRKGKK